MMYERVCTGEVKSREEWIVAFIKMADDIGDISYVASLVFDDYVTTKIFVPVGG